MALALTVPAPSRILAEMERRPAKVEKWLTTLPLLNVVETGHKLCATLQAYNRTSLEPSLRLELLELYRAPIRHIGQELQKQYVGLPLPMPEKHRIIAEGNREFHIELAYGYKHVVMSRADAERPTNMKDATPLALPIQRAIRHLTDVLVMSHLAYSPVPPNVWREIHSLYRHADQLDLIGVPLDEPLNTVRGKSTISEAYKHALLLDLGDPYHLPARMIAKIDQYLQAVAGLAVLQTPTGKTEPNCQFLIDTESDQPGIVHSDDDVLESLERYRLLNTLELARTIHTQITQLQAGDTPDVAGLPSDFFLRNGQEMLMRLINVWGVNPKRMFRRSERPNAKVEMAIGLAAIDFWLNGARRSAPTAAKSGSAPAEERASAGTFGAYQDRVDTTHTPTLWDIQDESAGGMALSKTGTARGRIRVGDIVATRSVGGTDWTISSVRWVKSANPSSVEVGIQRLAPTAKPALIKVVSGDQEDSDFLPALLLPAIAALKEPETLVIPANLFRPDRVYYLDDSAAARPIVATNLLEAASGYDRIEFEAKS